MCTCNTNNITLSRTDRASFVNTEQCSNYLVKPLLAVVDGIELCAERIQIADSLLVYCSSQSHQRPPANDEPARILHTGSVRRPAQGLRSVRRSRAVVQLRLRHVRVVQGVLPCTITLETRAFCKSCRLQKCFRCGMKKELILSELNYVVRPTLHVETPAQAACMLDPRIHRIFRRTSCSW